MTNLIRKIFVWGIMSIMIFGTTFTTAFASEKIEPLYNDDSITIIEVNSQEELDQVLAELDANKARVEALWNRAIEEAQKEENHLILQPKSNGSLMSPYSYSISVANGSHMCPNGIWAHPRFSATYEKLINGNGIDVFGDIYNISAYGEDDSTKVTVNTSQYTKIDGLRTLAANYSCLIGVKQFTGSFAYYTYAYYVEFYTSGNGYVWY